MSEPIAENSAPAVQPGGLSRGDFMVLTKARLSAMVVITTAAGFLLRSGMGGIGWQFLHTIIGTTLTAFGAAVFNQLMEMDADARMRRTADRPLPAQRVPPAMAFILGVILSAAGIIHLGVRVNAEASALAMLTLVVYIFIYTPMKRKTGLNTLVGAISGAIPPVIGWVGVMPGAELQRMRQAMLRWDEFHTPQALFLFSLLFLWQLPHFLAINWLHREEYERGGFVMWANGDVSGRKSAAIALGWAVPMIPLGLWPCLAGFASWWFAIPGVLLGAWITWLAVKFLRAPARDTGRRLFFATLIYLPLMLAALIAARL